MSSLFPSYLRFLGQYRDEVQVVLASRIDNSMIELLEGLSAIQCYYSCRLIRNRC
ncbi:MAG: hypothetical protein WD709_02485 [Gammaproteobacteria bacterium]